MAAFAHIACAIDHIRFIAKVVENHLPTTTVRLGIFQHQFQLLGGAFLEPFDGRGVGRRSAAFFFLADLADEKFLRETVLKAEQHHTTRRLPIAPGTTRFLVIRLQCARHVVVYDEPNVRLVDPHAKRIGRHGHRAWRAHELFLVGRPRRCAHPGVVRKDGAILDLFADHAADFVHVFTRRTVHNRAARFLANQVQQQPILVANFGNAMRAIAQVGPIKTGDNQRRLIQTQSMDNVLAHIIGSGGGERDGGRTAEPLTHFAELCIFRPKIVPPLADAVCLIDREQSRLEFFHQRLKPTCKKSLGGDVEQARVTVVQFRKRLPRLRRRHGAGEHNRRQTAIAKLHHLVFHQADQRRDDDREPALNHRRQLIAETLSRAGGHDAQHIFSAQNVFNDLALCGAEVVKPKEGLELLAEVGHRVRL